MGKVAILGKLGSWKQENGNSGEEFLKGWKRRLCNSSEDCFNGLMSRWITASQRTSELEETPIETFYLKCKEISK